MYSHDWQVTPPCTGFDVSIGWSCEFEVEEDDLFLGYVDTDALSIELMQVMCVYEGSVKALLRLN